MTAAARPKTLDLARGKWTGILAQLGVGKTFLTGKHTACPLCGGKDRFRYDDQDGAGTYFCSGCGAGTGMQLLQRLHRWDFATAARAIDEIVGNITPTQSRPKIDDDRRREMLRKLWLDSRPVTDGDPVDAYLTGRGLGLPQNRASLRYAPSCRAPDMCGGGTHPTMLAVITAPDGSAASMHRTFLGPNGKADINDPRATCAGQISDGSAIRLAAHGERLGIAEGIETALAASRLFGLPVWSAINATMLSKWQPPENVTQVVICGDNDAKFGGAAAAYALAKSLAVRGLTVEVRLPDRVGTDWADVWAEERAPRGLVRNG